MTDTGSGADPRGSSPDQPQSAEQPNPFSREAAHSGDALGAPPSSAPSAGAEPFDVYPPPAAGDPYASAGPYPQAYPAAQPFPAANPSPAGPPLPGFDPQPTPPYGSDVPASPYGTPAPAYGSNPYEYTPYQPAYGGTSPYAMVQVSHPKAGTAMVFGILGLVFGLSCGIGGLLGIPGIVQGRQARNEIDAEPGRYSGRSQAVAGIVTGIIGVVISSLIIVLIVVVALLGAAGEL